MNNTAYARLKKEIHAKSTPELLTIYNVVSTKLDQGIEYLVAFNALTSELEDRDAIRFNEDTCEFERV